MGSFSFGTCASLFENDGGGTFLVGSGCHCWTSALRKKDQTKDGWPDQNHKTRCIQGVLNWVGESSVTQRSFDRWFECIKEQQ